MVQPSSRPSAGGLAAALIAWVAFVPLAAADREPIHDLKHETKASRLAAIRHASVWSPMNVRGADLRTGPKIVGSFEPDEMVTCTFVDRALSGRTPKFACKIAPGDEAKVKFGQHNGEVFAEVAATRLLWALGFPADRMFPVRLVCRGCPISLWQEGGGRDDEVFFDPAAIERELPGHEIETDKVKGWSWPELDEVDESRGGAPRAQRDALKLLAVMIQHTDSKPEQQRLICVDESLAPDGECEQPVMMINDLGATFGRANILNTNAKSDASFKRWSTAPIWKDPDACVGYLPVSLTGTLDNPLISESGRKFLADLLVQLSDRQLYDLFDVARFPERPRDGSYGEGAKIEEWVKAFKDKRDDIVNHACP